MCEEKKEFDPRDRNQDGKVSVKEMMQDAVDKVDAAFTKAGDAIREGADSFINKAKSGEILDKASAAADKIAGAAKEVFDDVKEGAGNLFGNKPQQ